MLAVIRVADVRLLLRSKRRILREQEGVGAAAHPVEPGYGPSGSSELQLRKCNRPHGAGRDLEYGRLPQVGEIGGAGCGGGFSAVADQIGVSGWVDARAFHPVEADA